MLGVDLDGSRRIEPAHVGCFFGPDGSRYRRIVWMIIGMIKVYPTENRMARQAALGWGGGLEPAVGGVQVMCSGRIVLVSGGSWTVVR
jgi:hypothetical protein